MTVDMDKIGRAVDLMIKAEVHAIIMLLVGAGLMLHGMKDEGSLVVGGALAAFKGKSTS